MAKNAIFSPSDKNFRTIIQTVAEMLLAPLKITVGSSSCNTSFRILFVSPVRVEVRRGPGAGIPSVVFEKGAHEGIGMW